MLARRGQLAIDQLREFNRLLCKNLSFVWAEGGGLLPNASIKPAGKTGITAAKPLWSGFKSIRNEPDPELAILEAQPYLRWAYPRVASQTDLEFLIPAETDARWLKSSFGVWEPDPISSTKVSLSECVGVLVPGLAFDREGYRLGYGKGFYDRALVGFKGLKVGVAFSSSLVNESLPHSDHDQVMDLIVTETEIIRTKDHGRKH